MVSPVDLFPDIYRRLVATLPLQIYLDYCFLRFDDLTIYFQMFTFII